MRFTTSLLTLLLPLAIAAPAIITTEGTTTKKPDLSVKDWASIESSFGKFGSWSLDKAEQLLDWAQVGVTTDEDDTQQTIWQQLKGDPNSFSKLVKIIEFEGKAQKVLDDKDLQITFFAPNNDALTPPHHHHHHHDDDDDEDAALKGLLANPSLGALSDALQTEFSLFDDHHHHRGGDDNDDDDDDDKKKRRKEIFRFIAGKVLQYHGLPKAVTAQELAQNSTWATALKAEDGSFGGLHRRIKVEKFLVPPAVVINGYAKVLVTDKKARNGYFHTLNAPLLPPPSIFDIAYILPDFFSTLTSAVQGEHAVKYLDWHYDRENSEKGEPHFKGAPLVTLFAPDNKAFLALPFKLKLFLFSPFGKEALAKLLMYHSVPHTLLLSELQYHEKKEHKKIWGISDEIEQIEYFNLADDPSFKKELDVHTALPNSTLHIEIEKKKILPIEGAVKTTIKVNDQYAESIDIQARNGAIHVIGKVLIPPHHHHDHKGEDISSVDSWDNWEEWFPQWARDD